MPFLIILVGAALLALGVWSSRRTKAALEASFAWPTSPATIIESGLQQRQTVDPEGGSSSYTVFHTRYTYTVADTEIAATWESATTKRFAELAQTYALGKAATAHYDPAKPAHSTLEPTLKASNPITLLAYIFGGVALATGIFLLL